MTPFRATIVLPFDSYKAGAEDITTIDAAQIALMRECMAAKGYSWTWPRQAAREHPLLSGNARRYGLADSDAADRYGYHVPDTPESAQAKAAEAVWTDRLGDDQKAALFDRGGCVDEASAALRKGVDDRHRSWFTGMEHQAVDQSAEDPAVARAITAWSSCMHEGGYNYRTPQDTVEDRRWNLDAPRVSPAERAVATADVRCKQQTRLIPTRAAAEKRIQTKMLDEHADRFDAVLKSHERFVSNARRILADVEKRRRR
ncbi:hypothetical protein [Nonomuraea sp. B19D2]|uniref:hypothetical protein n=1 Tax=Nonomuraea sp. B19D2 TaxID=3159561 RepID=UPI0032D9BAA9